MSRLRSTACWAGVMAAAMLLPVLQGPAADAPTAGLVDRHWAMVGPEEQRAVELRVLATNARPEALAYRVRFTVERRDPPAAAAAPTGSMSMRPYGWLAVQSLEVRGDPLTPGASEEVATQFPERLLVPGRPHRFRAELLDDASGAVLAEVFVTKRKDRSALAWLPGAALAAALAGGGGGGGNSHERLDSFTGSGTMVGTHEARRVGSEWVEHGQGVIRVQGRNFSMVINYTYDSHGTSAATLSAVGTGAGSAQLSGKQPVPVNITTATATVGEAGARRQEGTVVTRTGCTATGTFDGTMGTRRYQGVVTMTNGTQTLDLTTYQGAHRFDIQFTASE